MRSGPFIYYLQQGGYAIGSVYLSIYLSVCPCVCPSVCGQDFPEITGWIFLKISPGVDLGQGTTPFNFHDDPDPDPDSESGSFFAIHVNTWLNWR